MTQTPSSEDQVLLGIIDLDEAKRLRNALEDRGVQLSLVANPGYLFDGQMYPRVEVYARAQDVPTFEDHVRAERARMLEGHEVGSHADAVFDPTQGQATCPACGTGFSTTASECPECGLGFSAGADLVEDSDEGSDGGCGHGDVKS